MKGATMDADCSVEDAVKAMHSQPVTIPEEMPSGLWWFAHPYTCLDSSGNPVLAAEEANFRLCCWRTAQLILRGYNVYSPVCHSHPIHMACAEFLTRNEHALWYRLDKDLLERATWTGIICAPGWQNSKGCVQEKAWFEQRGLPVQWWENIVVQVGPFV